MPRRRARPEDASAGAEMGYLGWRDAYRNVPDIPAVRPRDSFESAAERVGDTRAGRLPYEPGLLDRRRRLHPRGSWRHRSGPGSRPPLYEAALTALAIAADDALSYRQAHRNVAAD
ncbi:hypothetical protein ACIA5H_23525 [Nocardia sp. NPDC051900]|uniref:hypothetical protein n=1 Tax=Nocardia sp. NPDC051900 TaxID=3364326 RepID=UPI0037B9334D